MNTGLGNMQEAAEEELEQISTPPTAGNVLTGEAFSQPLEVLLSKAAISVPADATIRQAVALMREHGFGAILATEGDKLVGILTERDVIFKLVGVVDDFLDRPVSSAMTRDPIALQREDGIVHVAHNMQVGGYRHVPIVDEENRPVSVVSIKDVARFVLSHFPDEVLNNVPEPYRGPPKMYGG
jgi:CBS domain-containing protein